MTFAGRWAPARGSDLPEFSWCKAGGRRKAARRGWKSRLARRIGGRRSVYSEPICNLSVMTMADQLVVGVFRRTSSMKSAR